MDTVGAKSHHAAVRARILLAEDNPVNQELARHMLERLGCDVEVAGDGKAAVKAFKQQGFDLVFMDCQMPRLDGFQASRMIRDLEKIGGMVSHVPIVALTAHVDRGEQSKCLASGMDDYLNKPFKEHQLTAVLTKWLPDLVGQPPIPIAEEGQRKESCPRREKTAVLDSRALDAIRKLQRPGKEDLLAKVVGLFDSLLPGQLDDLRQAIAGRDAVTVEQVAHKLKSSCGNLGATAMSELCRELELLGKSGDLDRASSLLDRIEKEAEQVKSALAAEVSNSVPSV